MSGSIQGTGNQPVNFNAPSIGEAGESSRAVGSGLIGNDAKLQMMQAKKAITNSQLAHRPTLLKPKEMGMTAQASANQAASNDLTGLGEITKKASLNVANAMVRAQLGMQTPEDQAMFQRNASTLADSADYMDSLFKGKGELTKNEKANILGGQGFDDHQIEDLLLSQSDRAAFKVKLQQKHGNLYNQKLADLKTMGYDDHQADMLLVLGDDNIMKNDNRKAELNRLFKDNNEAKKLVEMGFNEPQIKALLNNREKGNQYQTRARTDSDRLLKLNEKLGFNNKEAGILKATAASTKQTEVLNILNRDPSSVTALGDKLRTISRDAQTIANSPLKPFLEEHLKQQADIFMVLELIHEMSVKQRRFAREFRQLEYDAATKETMKQADHIRKAAVMQLAADCVQGGMSIAGGMMSMGAGFKGARSGKKSASAKKGSDISADDVQISKSGAKKTGANDPDTASGANRKDTKKQQSKQTAADSDADSTQAKRQDTTEQKQQEGMAEDAQNARERRSDSQSENQRVEAETKETTKSEIKAENKKADNDAQTQRANDSEAESQKAAVEIKEENLVRPATGRRTRKSSRGSGLSRRSQAETDALIARAEANGKISPNMRKGLNNAATKDTTTQPELSGDGADLRARQQKDTASSQKGKKAAADTDADPTTIRQKTSLIRDKAAAKKQAAKDTEANAQKSQEKKAESNLDAQELEGQNNAHKKQQVTKDQDKDAQSVREHKSDSQADAQGAETDLNNQKKKQEAIEQNKDAEESDAAVKSDSDEIAARKERKNQEEQSNLNALQGQAATINAVFGGLGSVASAGFRFLAAEEQALQKESEARQKTHENAAQAWSEWMQLHQDQVKNCQSKIDEINRIHFDTLKSLSRG